MNKGLLSAGLSEEEKHFVLQKQKILSLSAFCYCRSRGEGNDEKVLITLCSAVRIIKQHLCSGRGFEVLKIMVLVCFCSALKIGWFITLVLSCHWNTA